MQVEDLLTSTAARAPRKTALVCGERRFDYASLSTESARFAALLVECGLERGGRVAVYLDACPEAVFAIFGTLAAGGAFVPVNTAVRSARLAHVLEHSGTCIVVTSKRHCAKLAEALGEDARALIAVVVDADADEVVLPCAVVAWSEALGQGTARRGIDADLAALVYTSGSTGLPKGVVVTHACMLATTRSIAEYLDNAEHDVILSVLPLSFGYGLYQLLTSVMVGATLVLEASFAYPAVVVARLEAERATGFPMVPTIWALLLDLAPSPEVLASLRYVTNAGAALPAHQVERFRAAYPDVDIYSMYGQTECQRIAYLPPEEEIDARPGSVGRAMPNLEAYVADSRGVPVPPGETGELVVRGASVMQGYWNAPEATSKVLGAGRFIGDRVLHTGDLFRTDAEGFLYFVSRMDDIIKTRGEKVSPREVEQVLAQMDGVVMAAVVGVPDELLGEIVKAVIVPREGVQLRERDVRRHCARHLEDWMVPKRVEFRTELPTTPSGKVDKLSLQGRSIET